MAIQKKIVVKGNVQGVGYRYFCYNRASSLNIKGYAKNLYDGSVEVIASGDKNNIEVFIGHLHQGPMMSQVRSVDITDIEEKIEYSGFRMY